MDLRGKDEFEFFLPVELVKSQDGDSKRWIQGIASTADIDLQDEIVVQAGIDTAYFLKYGFINDDHKPGPEHKVGEPTECRATKAGLWLKGFLYKGDGTERCDYWWQHLEKIERSGGTRKVGFSIQGKIMRRAGKSILKCWLQDIAITASPVNTHTWAEIVKSLAAERFCIHPWKPIEKACKGCPGNAACGTSLPALVQKQEDEQKALTTLSGSALRVQSLEGGPTNLTFKSLPDRISRAEAQRFVQQQYGLAPATARTVTDAIFTSNGIH